MATTTVFRQNLSSMYVFLETFSRVVPLIHRDPKKLQKKKIQFKVSSRLLMEYGKMIRAGEPSTEETV